MFAASTAMAAATKDPDLVNEITFLQCLIFYRHFMAWQLLLPFSAGMQRYLNKNQTSDNEIYYHNDGTSHFDGGAM